MYPNLNLFGKEIRLYDSMYGVGIVGMFIICMLTAKKYKVSKPRAVIYTLITFVFGVTGAKLMSRIYVASMTAVSAGEYVPESGVCLFGALMFLPVFMILLALLSGESYRKLMDYMTPGIFFILACSKIGCLLGGCCHGYFTDSGIYNHSVEAYTFPVQLYESLCTFAVTAVLLFIATRRKTVRYGALYPAGTIMYCSARFVWENFRYYEHECEFNFFSGLTYWQCWAVFSVILSAVWLVVLYSKPKYKNCELNNSFKSRIEYINGIIAENEEKRRKKHAEKAKLHSKKAKEIKNKNK